MRVLDDLGDVDAVILDLDASRGQNADGAEGRGNASVQDAASTERDTATPPAAEAGDDARDEKLHTPADDERGEGRLDDFDVEVPAPQPPP
jgi:hypothetical protein